jgi:hypothetical protein
MVSLTLGFIALNIIVRKIYFPAYDSDGMSVTF